eukprot:m51a1_g5001 hypothetical protein (127) ;mRNA; r:222313-222930
MGNYTSYVPAWMSNCVMWTAPAGDLEAGAPAYGHLESRDSVRPLVLGGHTQGKMPAPEPPKPAAALRPQQQQPAQTGGEDNFFEGMEPEIKSAPKISVPRPERTAPSFTRLQMTDTQDTAGWDESN